ncbi:MAG: hypothetical protein WBP64_14715 [Nitrososphaeraceae archaeon]
MYDVKQYIRKTEFEKDKNLQYADFKKFGFCKYRFIIRNVQRLRTCILYPGHLKFFDVPYKGRRKIISNWMRSNIQLIVHHIPRIFAVMQTTWDDEIFNIIQLWMADHHGQKSGISLPRTLQLHQDAVLIKELIMIYETHKFKN